MSRIVSRLKPLHRNHAPYRREQATRLHRRFCRQVEMFCKVVFAVRSQLNPERLARFVKAGDPYAHIELPTPVRSAHRGGQQETHDPREAQAPMEGGRQPLPVHRPAHKGARLIRKATCVKVEEIQMKWSEPFYNPHIVAPGRRLRMWIDGEELCDDEREALAKRDGFRDLVGFVMFWHSRIPFTGDIIHWDGSAKC